MVVINRMRKDGCENSHVCHCSLLDSHAVQSGAANAGCNLGQSHATFICTPTLLSKKDVELFYTGRGPVKMLDVKMTDVKLPDQ